MVSLTSPSTGNLQVGKGIYEFMPTGFSEFRDMGETRECEVTLNVEELEHFTQRSGIKSKDLIVTLQRQGTIRSIFEEFTPFNIAMWALGTVDEAAPGGATVSIMSEESITGKVRFRQRNDVGPRWNIELFNVRYKPSASINFISDEWGGIEVEGEILFSADDDGFGFLQLTNLVAES